VMHTGMCGSWGYQDWATTVLYEHLWGILLHTQLRRVGPIIYGNGVCPWLMSHIPSS